MRLTKMISTMFLIVSLAGCAIHPSPQDVLKPRNTVSIVDQLKCETMFAIRDKTIDKLTHNDLKGVEKEAALDLASKLYQDPEYFTKLQLSDLRGKKTIDFFKRYINAAVAYDFTFDAFEDNALSTEVDFARLITNGTVSLPIAASNDTSRHSVKTFTITETFKSLLENRPGCQRASTTPNFAYPISGSIGIADIIDTFVDLNEEKDLILKKGAPSIYADALTFTTTTMGSAVPKLVLASPARAFHLTGAMLNAAETRKDIDMVTIGLALPQAAPGVAPAQATKDVAVGAIIDQRQILVQNSIIRFFATQH